MKKENKMKAELMTKPDEANVITRWGCTLCGAPTIKSNVVIDLYRDDVAIGVICRRCVAAGQVEASDRVRAQAAALREKADELDQLANELEVTTGHWTTTKELEAFEAEVEERWKRWYEKEHADDEPGLWQPNSDEMEGEGIELPF
jgi:hypothetical protein